MYSNGPPHMAKQKQDDQLEHTNSSDVRRRDVALTTCQRRWIIERSGEKGSGISMLAARHVDDDDDDMASSFRIESKYFLNISVWSTNGTVTDGTILNQGKPGSNDNKKFTPHNSESPSDRIYSHTQNTPFCCIHLIGPTKNIIKAPLVV